MISKNTLKEIILSDGQNDDYGQLSREHAKQAKKRIKKMFKNKNFSLCGNKVFIGEREPIIIEIN